MISRYTHVCVEDVALLRKQIVAILDCLRRSIVLLKTSQQNSIEMQKYFLEKRLLVSAVTIAAINKRSKRGEKKKNN